MTSTQFKAYGFGVFPTPPQVVTLDTGGTPFYEYFKDEVEYKSTLQYALSNLRVVNSRQVLFVIPGGKR